MEKPPVPANARALVLPSDDAARTVVIAPCGTDPRESADDAREDRATPNTVRFVFPRGGGDRAVLVPDCSPKAGVSAANSGLPAAAFVLPVGTRENRLEVPPLRAESQAVVPNGSEAKTVVISPCTGQVGGEAGKPVAVARGRREPGRRARARGGPGRPGHRAALLRAARAQPPGQRTCTWSSWCTSSCTRPRGPRSPVRGPTNRICAPSATNRSTRSCASGRSIWLGLTGGFSTRSRRG